MYIVRIAGTWAIWFVRFLKLFLLEFCKWNCLADFWVPSHNINLSLIWFLLQQQIPQLKLYVWLIFSPNPITSTIFSIVLTLTRNNRNACFKKHIMKYWLFNDAKYAGELSVFLKTYSDNLLIRNNLQDGLSGSTWLFGGEMAFHEPGQIFIRKKSQYKMRMGYDLRKDMICSLWKQLCQTTSNVKLHSRYILHRYTNFK